MLRQAGYSFSFIFPSQSGEDSKPVRCCVSCFHGEDDASEPDLSAEQFSGTLRTYQKSHWLPGNTRTRFSSHV